MGRFCGSPVLVSFFDNLAGSVKLRGSRNGKARGGGRKGKANLTAYNGLKKYRIYQRRVVDVSHDVATDEHENTTHCICQDVSQIHNTKDKTEQMERRAALKSVESSPTGFFTFTDGIVEGYGEAFGTTSLCATFALFH